MTLTMADRPLSARPSAPTNFRVDGPEHRLLFDAFPRRVRALFGGQVVFDTRRGKLLHETGHLPVLYVPEPDVRRDLLEPSSHHTHCPFKGEASYWSFDDEGQTHDGVVWSYETPIDEALEIKELMCFYPDRAEVTVNGERLSK